MININTGKIDKLVHEAVVYSVEKVKKDYVLLSLIIETEPLFKPGQFMMIRVSETYDPLLLRPFSILDQHDHLYMFLIKVVGRGTRLISDFKYGRRLFLTGPFGNGFPINVKSETVIAAGGVGIASVFTLVKLLHKQRIPYELIYGARTAGELVLMDLLKPYNVIITTDDGSLGYKGLVTDVLKSRIKHHNTIFACGPVPMLSVVKDVAIKKKSTCYLSLEARMACGFGVCLGCTIFDTQGNAKRVCRDGPVFKAEEVSFEE